MFYIVVFPCTKNKKKTNCSDSEDSFFVNVEQDEVSWIEWKKALYDTLVASQQHLTVSEKASKIYGADVSSTTSTNLNSNQQTSAGNHHNPSSSSSGGALAGNKKTNLTAGALQD